MFDVKDKVNWMFCARNVTAIQLMKQWQVVLVTGGSRGIGEMIATVRKEFSECVKIIINTIKRALLLLVQKCTSLAVLLTSVTR